jgi:GT2 family glycosyltransferase
MIGIVVVHYGDINKTNICLWHLTKNLCFDRKIVVINNNAKNLGYGAACNRGFDIIKHQCDYVVFMNNDIVVDKYFIGKIYTSIIVNRGDFGCPQIAFTDNKVDYNGGFSDGIISKLCPFLAKEFLHGGCMIAKTSAFEKIRFDERYFLYWEDVDFTMRAKGFGMKMVYFPNIKVVHDKNSATANNCLTRYYHARNALFCFKNNADKNILVGFYIYYFTIFITSRLAYFLFKRKYAVCKYILKGVIDYMKGKQGNI